MAVRLWVFGPFCLFVVLLGEFFGPIRVIPVLLCFAFGLLLWTGLEYLLHRFAFHGFAPHYQHHAQPSDRSYILAPLQLSIPVAGSLWIFFALLAGLAESGWILAGVIAGYLAYEAVHIWIHSSRTGGPFLRVLRKHHFYHHFADETVCYGVTSSLWDRVFDSLPAR